MSIRTRLSAIVLAAPLALLSMQAAQAQQPKFTYDGPVITLRLSHFAPENHPMSKAVSSRASARSRVKT